MTLKGSELPRGRFKDHAVMWMKSGPTLRFGFFFFCLLLLLVVSCGSKEEVIGTYQAVPGDSTKQVETVMELKANGVGIWKKDDEEVPFAWYVKDGELRVNTKGGGVIVGTLDRGSIRINLPGTGVITFKQVRRLSH